ncbi:MAG TPA: hypothetical protein VIX18_01420, partial [Nitrospirota bacterium]
MAQAGLPVISGTLEISVQRKANCLIRNRYSYADCLASPLQNIKAAMKMIDLFTKDILLVDDESGFLMG